MQYPNIHKGIFLKRPNRFIAQVELEGKTETVHVKNTGRCKELLLPGATVYLVRTDNPKRKTQFDLVAVEKGSLLVNMDSQAPNHVFEEYVRSGQFLPDLTLVKPEYVHGDSRFDFYLMQGRRQHLVEIKGVTLEEDGIARFPDAPTERGIKHIDGLIRSRDEGFEAWICFVVQMQKMKWVEPNDRTHPAFGGALRRAAEAGVHIMALECAVKPDQLEIVGKIPVKL